MSGVESTSIPLSVVISAEFVKLEPMKFASICATKVKTTGVPLAGKFAIVEVCGAVALNPVPLTNVIPAGRTSVTTILAAFTTPSLLTVISYVTLSPGEYGPVLVIVFVKAKS